MDKTMYMPGEMTIAELVQPQVTGADLNYVGSITISPEALTESGLLPGEMVYIDDVARKGPPWRTYIVPGNAGEGQIVMNGPPAYHFKKGDPVTI
ncbi:MAG: aspartate 1-decarboxylase, partial [Patescibacteria group bacterium]|nr:aspartate 1-decarboxylase [Patescibacteria group bacterium]